MTETEFKGWWAHHSQHFPAIVDRRAAFEFALAKHDVRDARSGALRLMAVREPFAGDHLADLLSFIGVAKAERLAKDGKPETPARDLDALKAEQKTEWQKMREAWLENRKRLVEMKMLPEKPRTDPVPPPARVAKEDRPEAMWNPAPTEAAPF